MESQFRCVIHHNVQQNHDFIVFFYFILITLDKCNVFYIILLSWLNIIV